MRGDSEAPTAQGLGPLRVDECRCRVRVHSAGDQARSQDDDSGSSMRCRRRGRAGSGSEADGPGLLGRSHRKTAPEPPDREPRPARRGSAKPPLGLLWLPQAEPRGEAGLGHPASVSTPTASGLRFPWGGDSQVRVHACQAGRPFTHFLCR